MGIFLRIRNLEQENENLRENNLDNSVLIKKIENDIFYYKIFICIFFLREILQPLKNVFF